MKMFVYVHNTSMCDKYINTCYKGVFFARQGYWKGRLTYTITSRNLTQSVSGVGKCLHYPPHGHTCSQDTKQLLNVGLLAHQCRIKIFQKFKI